MLASEYDVIVVGAGPAGSTAALALRRRGISVLLLDRDQFPRDKACGDAVPMPAINILYELGVDKLNPDVYFRSTHLKLIGPKGAYVTVKLKETKDANAGVITRYIFDNLIFEKAMECGAVYQQVSVTGPIIENGFVVGVTAREGKNTVSYRSKVVIAADGATSAIARTLNHASRPTNHKAIAVRGYVETDIDLDPTIELNFLSEFQPGYAWFFPMGKRLANIGVGIRSDFYDNQRLSLTDALAHYAQIPEMRKRIGQHLIQDVKSWQLPLASMEQQRIFNGCILVGDAGGFVDPLTGAGIRAGIITGKHAADTIAEVLQVGRDMSASSLADFDRRWRRDLERAFKRSTLISNLGSVIPPLIDSVFLMMRFVPGMGGLTGKI